MTSRRRSSSTRGPAARATKRPAKRAANGPASPLIARLEEIERAGGDGELRLPGGKRLAVSSLDKPYFPRPRFTKGDVMRYYVRVAPWILPVLRDRPLVLKRTPEGIEGESFFQQKPPATAAGVARVRVVETEIGPQERIIGGDLATLLYVVQIGCISMDPWGSRVRSLDSADYAVLDLDPGPEADFGRIVEVALAVKEVLDALGLHAAPKTSGSRGIHIAIPLPLRTTFEEAQALGERVATRVAEAHPRIATVERSLDDRPPEAVYVDFLQNARGKSVAAAYSVRAKPGATVSTPLDWSEVGPGLDPRACTMLTVPERIAERGDLWAQGMRRRNTARAVRAAVG